MNYLERSDARFVAQAGDDSERRAAIERLSGVRRITFRWAIVLGVCFLIVFTLGAVHPTFGAIGAVSGAFDGSVRYISYTAWYDMAAEFTKNQLWCYPGSTNGR